ncbi:MAG: hypothetical protein RR416_02285 [Clostridia bacterium]
MKKVILSVLTLALLITSCLFCFVGCDKKPEPMSFEPVDYSKMTAKANLDAYELFVELRDRMAITTNYVREEYFAFDADAQLMNPTQQNKYIVKRDGDNIFSESITIGELQGDAHTASRYFYDASKDSLYSFITKDKKIVPGKPKDEIDKFRVTQWGDYAIYKDGELTKADRLKRFKTHIATYDLTKKDYIDKTSDMKVYEKKDTLYFTLTLDCSEAIMTTVQKVARQEFLDSTGAKSDTFAMDKNTTIDFQAELVDGKYCITYFRRLEFYHGKSASFPVTVTCKQVCETKMTYGKECAITATEKMNLAK